jgi:chromosome segregation ATPase
MAGTGSKTTGKKPVVSPIIKAASHINALHKDVETKANNTIAAAIEVGEALVAQKEITPHGQWIPFVEKHLLINRVQASKYMKMYNERASILKVDASSINSALVQLAAPAEMEVIDADTPEGEKDQQIAQLKKELAEAQKQVEAFENDSSGDELQKDYEKALEELEAIKSQGDESEEDVEAAIVKLKKLREKLRKDVSGMEDLSKMLKKTRDFFAKEIALVPTLKISKAVIKHTAGDVEALVELMENWVTAMKEKFDV